MENKQDLAVLEKQLKILNKRLLSNTQLSVSEQEAEYLIKGFATELIDKSWVLDKNRNITYAKIYGVQAKEQSNGRYLWIYLFYNNSLYKCYNLKLAFDIIDELKKICELERKINRISKRITNRENLLQISSN